MPAPTETVSTLRSLAAPAVPQAICDWFRQLAGLGHRSLLVGESPLQLVLGRRPTHYLAHSSISRDALLSLAPRAVPTGVASGAITIATAAGPLDVLPGRSVEQTRRELEASPFGVLALALDPLTGETTARPQALREVHTRVLHPTDETTLGRDLGFALDAARLIASYGLAPTASLLTCARAPRPEIAPGERSRMRRLLRETLLAPGARTGLEFLRDCGAQAALVSGVEAGAAARVARVPAEFRVRMCAWLVAADAKNLLRKLRFGSEFSSHLYRLLDHHPIEQCLASNPEAAARKLLGRLSSAEIAELLALRRAEADVLRETDQAAEAERVRLAVERVGDTFERVRSNMRRGERRGQLAISGRQIVRQLACEPGPLVGRAIRFLEAAVEADPDANTPERLRALLEQWRER